MNEKRATMLAFFAASLFFGDAFATRTPKTLAGRQTAFRNIAVPLGQDLNLVEVACAGSDLPNENMFKYCAVYKGDYFSFQTAWKKKGAKYLNDVNRLWMSSQDGKSFGGEAIAKANPYWTFFADFNQRSSSTGLVSFGMFSSLEEH